MPHMTWKSELEKRVAIIEEFLRFHNENKEFNKEASYGLHRFLKEEETVSVLRDLAAIAPADHRINVATYSEDVCPPLHKRYMEIGYTMRNAIDQTSGNLQDYLEDYKKLIASEVTFRDKTHSEEMLALWELFKRSAREGSLKPGGDQFKNMGAEPTKQQHDELFYYDGDKVCLKYNSWANDQFKTKYQWMRCLSKPKYNQGQTVYFKTNAPVRKGRGYWYSSITDVEKAERKLAEEKAAGTLTNKPALVIEVPEIVPEGDYQGNRLYKVMLPGYPAPVCLPERCFKKSISTRGRKKNKSNLPA